MTETRDWCNIFTIIELCICTPCSIAEVKRFISQMQVVKTDWRSRLSEVNLTCLLRIEVADPSLKSFHDSYCHLSIDLYGLTKRRQDWGRGSVKNIEKEKAQKKLNSGSLICRHYLKQVAKVNWKKSPVQINVY